MSRASRELRAPGRQGSNPAAQQAPREIDHNRDPRRRRRRAASGRKFGRKRATALMAFSPTRTEACWWRRRTTTRCSRSTQRQDLGRRGERQRCRLIVDGPAGPSLRRAPHREGRIDQAGQSVDCKCHHLLAPERKTIADTWADGTTLTVRPNDLAADGQGGAYFTTSCLYYAEPEGRHGGGG